MPFLLSLGFLTVSQVTTPFIILFKFCTSERTRYFDLSLAPVSWHPRRLDSLITFCFGVSKLRIAWLMQIWVAHLLRDLLWLTSYDTEHKPGHNARPSDETTERWLRISHIDVKVFSLCFYDQNKNLPLRTFCCLWEHTIFYLFLHQLLFLLAIKISGLKCERMVTITSVLLANKHNFWLKLWQLKCLPRLFQHLVSSRIVKFVIVQ